MAAARWSSPAPTVALEQMIRDMRFSNELPVEHMARLLEPRIESVREGLAKEFGSDTEEIAIDAFHHTVYALATGIAYELLGSPRASS